MHNSPLTTVMYVSRALIGSQQVDSLVAASRDNNARRGITGGMLFTGRYFAQILEGPTEQVTSLMTAICTDARHDTVKPVLREELTVRRFPMWTMGYVALPFADQILLPLMTEPVDGDNAARLRSILMTAIGRDQGIKVPTE